MTYCPKCGRQNDNLARFCQTCGNELRTIGPVSRATFYAGFWSRFAALIIDVVVLGVAGLVITAGTVGFAFVSISLLPWIYEAVMLSSEKQATLGKLAMGLVVTDTEGRRISFFRATGRHFGKYVSALILGIGYLMAAFTRKKQALHDMMADTLVVTK
jgi:uncharacterized RDD family membrane protein YckC